MEAVFELERETKNTYRFQELTQGKPPIIKTLYVQKWVFKNRPRKIKVTVEVLE
ncbi:MAG: hypothetical protein ACTSR0_04175 [Candidatus Asgardarchaeia archaeon]